MTVPELEWWLTCACAAATIEVQPPAYTCHVTPAEAAGYGCSCSSEESRHPVCGVELSVERDALLGEASARDEADTSHPPFKQRTLHPSQRPVARHVAVESISRASAAASKDIVTHRSEEMQRQSFFVVGGKKKLRYSEVCVRGIGVGCCTHLSVLKMMSVSSSMSLRLSAAVTLPMPSSIERTIAASSRRFVLSGPARGTVALKESM